MAAVLGCVYNKRVEDKTIGWLCNDTNLFWLNVLGSIAMGFIVRVTVSLVMIYGKSMDKKAMQTIFCLVFTFNYVANKLFLNLKDILHIKGKSFSGPLKLVCIKSQNYDQDSNENNTKIPLLSLFSSIVYLPTFVQLTHDTNNNFCKLFVTIPAYQAYAKNNKN